MTEVTKILFYYYYFYYSALYLVIMSVRDLSSNLIGILVHTCTQSQANIQPQNNNYHV